MMKMTIYKVIWQFEPGDITSVYDVWAGSINAETDGFCGQCIASYSTAAEAYSPGRTTQQPPTDRLCGRAPSCPGFFGGDSVVVAGFGRHALHLSPCLEDLAAN